MKKKTNKFETISEIYDCLAQMNKELQDFIKKYPCSSKIKTTSERLQKLITLTGNLEGMILDNNSLLKEIEMLKKNK